MLCLMGPEAIRIVVIRAWREGREVRVRILVEGAPDLSRVVRSPAEAGALVVAILSGLAEPR